MKFEKANNHVITQDQNLTFQELITNKNSNYTN